MTLPQYLTSKKGYEPYPIDYKNGKDQYYKLTTDNSYTLLLSYIRCENKVVGEILVNKVIESQKDLDQLQIEYNNFKEFINELNTTKWNTNN